MLPLFPSHYFVLLLWLLVLSVVSALMEIQIEGKDGWAAKLPTWRFGPQWIKVILNGKVVTGYHLYYMLLCMLFFHFPILFTGFSWLQEAMTLSLYFTYTVIWDFLWFALNPAFGWKRFSKENIWWFAKWIGHFPDDYYFNLTLAGCFAALCGMLPGALSEPSLVGTHLSLQYVGAWFLGLAGQLLCIIIVTVWAGRGNVPAA